MSRSPQISLQLRTFTDDPDHVWSSTLALGQAMDAAGVDRVVVSDHVVFGENPDAYGDPALGGIAGGRQPTGPDGQWLEPLTVLTALAAVTTHIRLGTAVLLAALRRPAVLAKQVSTLDVLSGGRVDLGVGVGWQREEYEAAGLPFGRCRVGASAIALLSAEADSVAAYVVTESMPIPPPDPGAGQRTPGLANVALLRRPTELDQATWLHRWQINHTPVAIATQATFGYTQNVVVRPLTEDAPVIDRIVEELFPDGAVSDLHVWYGARDDTDLHDRLARMIESVSAFGADKNIDTVPTSRYLFRAPFIAAD